VRQVDRLTPPQVDQLIEWFATLWWIHGRTRAGVETMLDHCVVIALVDEGDRLAAFARVISDQVYKALILDVVVDEARRGTGLGAAIMDAVLAHPVVAGCEHLELYCAPDMVAFYERYGFTSELGTLTFMRAARG
jgi:GNAT superfamily N-acetyltransferase